MPLCLQKQGGTREVENSTIRIYRILSGMMVHHQYFLRWRHLDRPPQKSYLLTKLLTHPFHFYSRWQTLYYKFLYHSLKESAVCFDGPHPWKLISGACPGLIIAVKVKKKAPVRSIKSHCSGSCIPILYFYNRLCVLSVVQSCQLSLFNSIQQKKQKKKTAKK